MVKPSLPASKRLGAALAVTLFSITACAGVSSTASAPARSPSSHPLALPPRFPCVYPNSSAIASLANASDSVIDAMVGPGTFSTGPFSTPPAGNWDFPLSRVSILASRPGTVVPTVIGEDGVSTHKMLSPGEYILFLTRSYKSSFFATNGMLGAFPVDAGGVVRRQCANYQDPFHPLAARGTPLNRQRFTSFIPLVLAPKPTLREREREKAKLHRSATPGPGRTTSPARRH